MVNPMAEFPRRLGHITGPPLGRPRAVDAALVAEGKRLLSEGLGVRALCERLGVGATSWYRALRPFSSKPRPRRNKQALPKATVRKLKTLRQQWLTLRAIAERLGLHVNTLHKYYARMGLDPMMRRKHAGPRRQLQRRDHWSQRQCLPCHA